MSVSPASDAERVDAVVAEVSARRELTTSAVGRIRADALSWVDGWYRRPLQSVIDLSPLPPDLTDKTCGNAARYGAWHVVGGSNDAGAGFVALHGLAIRQARGDVERATEAASETYLDVRSRLEKTVPRSLKGRSIPDFQHPGANGEDNVRHYHLIQTRLRLAGKWEARRRHTEFDERQHAMDWQKEFAAAETRTYSVALHFAALWYLADVRSKTTRAGRLKDRSWWWDVLQHGLDRIKLASLGGDRNDPTEALHRLRLRFRVCQGLSPWLKQWAVGKPYWAAVDFDLPDIENEQARASVQLALEQIRPALEVAIESLDLPPQEARALVGTLLKGENVRTSTRHFAGDDPAARWERFSDLGEDAGRGAARHLGGGGGGRGGGGGSSHDAHGERLSVMASLREGAVPSMEDLVTLREAVSSCPDCADAWSATCDADRYIRAVSTQEPEPVRSPVPVLAGLAVGVLALALLVPAVLLNQTTEEIGLRGPEGAPAVHLDLFVVEAGADNAERFNALQTYHPGDRVYFNISADTAVAGQEITVWVEGPEGEARLGVEPTATEPVRLGGMDEAVFYEFEKTGRYHFRASSVGMEACPDKVCVERAIEVKR